MELKLKFIQSCLQIEINSRELFEIISVPEKMKE